VLTAGTLLSATQSATFRTATETVPVQVTVRTNAGEIVRGLTAKDFEVFKRWRGPASRPSFRTQGEPEGSLARS